MTLAPVRILLLEENPAIAQMVATKNPNQAKNTRDDLINSGIPQEQIHVDQETHTIRVMMPAEEDAEIFEIFDRHGVTH